MLKDKVFVYGTLKNGMCNFNNILKDKVKDLRKGKIVGELYYIDNKEYPAALEGNETIDGELLEFYNFKETLQELDKLESYEKGNMKSEYVREIKEVYLEDGTKELAYVYMYNTVAPCNMEDILIQVENGDFNRYLEEKVYQWCK